MPSFLSGALISTERVNNMRGGNTTQRLVRALRSLDFVESKGTTLGLKAKRTKEGFDAEVLVDNGLGSTYRLFYAIKPHVPGDTGAMAIFTKPVSTSSRARAATEPTLTVERVRTEWVSSNPLLETLFICGSL